MLFPDDNMGPKARDKERQKSKEKGEAGTQHNIKEPSCTYIKRRYPRARQAYIITLKAEKDLTGS